jgi:hypothetical protein
MLTEFLADLTACGRDPKTVAGYKGDLTHASKRLARRHVPLKTDPNRQQSHDSSAPSDSFSNSVANEA